MNKDFVIENGVLKEYIGTESDVIIPEGVTEIAHFASNHDIRKRIISVALPNSIIKIGDLAFWNCENLRTITIPDSVMYIGGMAFKDCRSLGFVKIPTGVTRIKHKTFKGCYNLDCIIIPDSVKEIEYTAFMYCHCIRIICSENSYAYEFCKKEKLPFFFDYQYEAYHGVIPSRIEKIPSPFHADEEEPFVFISYSHKDRDIVFGIIKTLYESGWRIWYDEGLTIGEKYDATLVEHIKNCAVFLLFVSENSKKSHYINSHEIPWAKEYCKPIIMCKLDEKIDCEADDVISPFNIDSALQTIRNLTKGHKREAKGISVLFDPTVKSESQGDGFAYCVYEKESQSIVKSILLEVISSGGTIYNAIENGDDENRMRAASCLIAFIDKKFLLSPHLIKLLLKCHEMRKPVAVCQLEIIEDTSLPKELTEIYKEHWMTYATDNPIDLYKNLANYLFIKGCRNAALLPGFTYEMSEQGIVITRYTGQDPAPRIEREYNGIPVVKIADSAFCNCILLEKLDIPFGITNIGFNAFSGCVNLTAITIPASVTSIGQSAFSECCKLRKIIIPNSVSSIGDFAFCGCSSLLNISIPDSVIKIGMGAFEGCEHLQSISLSECITSIEHNTFSNCKSLTNIIIPSKVSKVGSHAFFLCERLPSITIPDSVTKIEWGAFGCCKNLTSIILSKRLTVIEQETFYACDNLKSIIIPNSITKIEKEAFSACTGLRSIEIPYSVIEIGKGAFWACSLLTIHGFRESYAELFARRHNIPFLEKKGLKMNHQVFLQEAELKHPGKGEDTLTIIVTNKEGKQLECEVLFTYESKTTGECYIAFIDTNQVEATYCLVYTSKYKSRYNKMTLIPIESEEDWEVIRQAFEEYKNSIEFSEF